MTILERLAIEEQMLVDSIKKVLEQESALDWIVTPALPLIHKVYVTAKADHNRLFCDEYIKRTINKVCAKKRREMKKGVRAM